MTMIKSINLRKTYQNTDEFIYALFDCNLEISDGEFVIISGAKKSGKTTLLHLLGGFEKPSGGLIYINNQNISKYDEDELAILRRNEIGFMLHNDSLIPELTVHENIIMPLILAQKKYDENYYVELADQLHISGILNQYPKILTTNQLRSVAYARALINNPNIILMDDPLNDLYHDSDSESLDNLLHIISKYHKTLIMATNNPEFGSYANHIIRLRDGVVVEDRLT
ncbi:MAG TPA: ABC transporter ATP-binding protein [Mobilitalea sp.]|nr:ABC transporter ATP-binding protein [Mobilitalea sp.]